MKTLIISRRGLALAAIALAAATFNGCSEDNPIDPPNDVEHPEPTRMALILVNSADATDSVQATWQDADGIGGNAPSRIDTLRLKQGITYNGVLRLYNDQEGVEVTPFIKEEGDQHQFFYTPSAPIAGRVIVTTTDKDSKNLPVGLAYTVTVGAGESASGAINVVLGHYDDAPKDGTTRSPESDIDVDIPVLIR